MDRETATVERSTPDHSPWAFFACGARGFAIRLDQVVEIVPPQPFTRLPGCGREVCGLVGLRGRLITVFDLGVLSGGAAAMSLPDHRIVLIRHRGRIVGLTVETMVTITAPDASAGGGDGTDVQHGREVADELAIAGRTFTILDPDRLFGPLLA